MLSVALLKCYVLQLGCELWFYRFESLQCHGLTAFFLSFAASNKNEKFSLSTNMVPLLKKAYR
jgi:hypothetical protein